MRFIVPARILSDDWQLNGKACQVIDWEPVRGSTQCLVEIDGGAPFELASPWALNDLITAAALAVFVVDTVSQIKRSE